MIRGRIHTDLALEAKERYEEDNVEIRGVCIEEEYDKEKDIRTTLVKIETENGARAMGRPQGSYLTLEAPNLSIPDEDYHREISEELARQVKKLIPEKKELTVLVVGLGNRQVTPDALGPDVVDNLKMTRHIILEYGVQAMGEQNRYQVSGLVPGVMAQTGMETLEIVKGVINETRPDVVIAVDALAARSTKRLNRTIQITDTGNPDNIIEELTTDNSGETPSIELPAPPVSYSLESSSAQPYSEYNFTIQAEGYSNLTISGAQILANVTALQSARLMPLANIEASPIVVPPHTLYGNFPPKIAEAEIKDVTESGEVVLSRVVIPETIIVHDGPPTDTRAAGRADSAGWGLRS